jgi:hypothetical protein
MTKKSTFLTRTYLAEAPLRPKNAYETAIPEHGPIERPVLYISRSTKPYEQGYQATDVTNALSTKKANLRKRGG